MSVEEAVEDKEASGVRPPAGSRKSSPPPPLDWRAKLAGWPPQQWGSMFWYFALMLGMLWFWQEASHQLTTRTIPYSQFKDLVAQSRVADLTINETEIDGKVIATPARESKAGLAANSETNGPNPMEAKPAEVLKTTGLVKGAAGTDSVPVISKLEGGKVTGARAETYLFRTVRVEDPDLVHGVPVETILRFNTWNPVKAVARKAINDRITFATRN